MSIETRNLDKNKQRTAIERLKLENHELDKRKVPVPYPTYSSGYREHNSWMSVFLALIFVAGIFQAFAFLTTISRIASINAEFQNRYSSIDYSIDSTAFVFMLVIQIAMLGCIWAIGKWQYWGYQVMLVCYVLTIFVALLSNSAPLAVRTFITALILHVLIEHEKHLYDRV